MVGQIRLFTNNATNSDTLESIVFKEFSKKYDFLMSYSANSFWCRLRTRNIIIANKKNKWSLIFYDRFYSEDTSGYIIKSQPIKTKIYKKRINKRKVNELLLTFDAERIWNFDTDSLSIMGRKLNDSMSTFISMTHGVSHRFEFISKDGYRIVECYNPEGYLKELPEIVLRQNFINCIEKFWKVTNSRKKYLR